MIVEYAKTIWPARYQGITQTSGDLDTGPNEYISVNFYQNTSIFYKKMRLKMSAAASWRSLPGPQCVLIQIKLFSIYHSVLIHC